MDKVTALAVATVLKNLRLTFKEYLINSECLAETSVNDYYQGLEDAYSHVVQQLDSRLSFYNNIISNLED